MGLQATCPGVSEGTCLLLGKLERLSTNLCLLKSSSVIDSRKRSLFSSLVQHVFSDLLLGK